MQDENRLKEKREKEKGKKKRTDGRNIRIQELKIKKVLIFNNNHPILKKTLQIFTLTISQLLILIFFFS